MSVWYDKLQILQYMSAVSLPCDSVPSYNLYSPCYCYFYIQGGQHCHKINNISQNLCLSFSPKQLDQTPVTSMFIQFRFARVICSLYLDICICSLWGKGRRMTPPPFELDTRCPPTHTHALHMFGVICSDPPRLTGLVARWCENTSAYM